MHVFDHKKAMRVCMPAGEVLAATESFVSSTAEDLACLAIMHDQVQLCM